VIDLRSLGPLVTMRHLTLFGKFIVQVSSQIESLEGDFVIVASGVHLSEIDTFSFSFPKDSFDGGGFKVLLIACKH